MTNPTKPTTANSQNNESAAKKAPKRAVDVTGGETRRSQRLRMRKNNEAAQHTTPNQVLPEPSTGNPSTSERFSLAVGDTIRYMPYLGGGASVTDVIISLANSQGSPRAGVSKSKMVILSDQTVTKIDPVTKKSVISQELVEFDIKCGVMRQEQKKTHCAGLNAHVEAIRNLPEEEMAKYPHMKDLNETDNSDIEENTDDGSANSPSKPPAKISTEPNAKMPATNLPTLANKSPTTSSVAAVLQNLRKSDEADFKRHREANLPIMLRVCLWSKGHFCFAQDMFMNNRIFDLGIGLGTDFQVILEKIESEILSGQSLEFNPSAQMKGGALFGRPTPLLQEDPYKTNHNHIHPVLLAENFARETYRLAFQKDTEEGYSTCLIMDLLIAVKKKSKEKVVKQQKASKATDEEISFVISLLPPVIKQKIKNTEEHELRLSSAEPMKQTLTVEPKDGAKISWGKVWFALAAHALSDKAYADTSNADTSNDDSSSDDAMISVVGTNSGLYYPKRKSSTLVVPIQNTTELWDHARSKQNSVADKKIHLSLAFGYANESDERITEAYLTENGGHDAADLLSPNFDAKSPSAIDVQRKGASRGVRVAVHSNVQLATKFLMKLQTTANSPCESAWTKEMIQHLVSYFSKKKFGTQNAWEKWDLDNIPVHKWPTLETFPDLKQLSVTLFDGKVPKKGSFPATQQADGEWELMSSNTSSSSAAAASGKESEARIMATAYENGMKRFSEALLKQHDNDHPYKVVTFDVSGFGSKHTEYMSGINKTMTFKHVVDTIRATNSGKACFRLNQEQVKEMKDGEKKLVFFFGNGEHQIKLEKDELDKPLFGFLHTFASHQSKDGNNWDSCIPLDIRLEQVLREQGGEIVDAFDIL